MEEEQNGLSKIQIRVSPSVGTFSENALIETGLAVLRSYPGAKKLMSDRWREADTLRVVRAEPIATLAAKTLPLHILSKAQPKAP